MYTHLCVCVSLYVCVCVCLTAYCVIQIDPSPHIDRILIYHVQVLSRLPFLLLKGAHASSSFPSTSTSLRVFLFFFFQLVDKRLRTTSGD